MHKDNQNLKEHRDRIIKVTLPFLIILLILCPFSFILNKIILKDRNKIYSSLTINNINADYKLSGNLKLVNSLEVKKAKDNFYYNTNESLAIAKINDAASKLGLNVKNQNLESNIYAWGENLDLKGDRILFDANKGTVDIRYLKGINNNVTIDKNSAYKFLSEFFGFGTLEIETIESNISPDTRETYTYKPKFNNKKLFFNNVSDVVADIDNYQGKIIGAFLRVIPSNNFQKGSELKPIEIIDSEKLERAYYTDKIESDKPTAVGNLGSDFTVLGNITSVIKQYQECYFYNFDMLKENIVIVPALYVTGDYQDESGAKGTIKFVVINQDNSLRKN